MVPKYTLKFDMVKGNDDNQNNQKNFVLDADYNNLKRIQNEIEDALKSVNARYSKKVIQVMLSEAKSTQFKTMP